MINIRVRAITLNQFKDIVRARVEHNHYKYCPESDSVIITIKDNFEVSLEQAYYTNKLFDFVMNDNDYNEDYLDKDFEAFICDNFEEWLYHNDPNMALECEYELFR